MEKMTSLVDVSELINFLEIKQANEKRLVKEEFKTTLENLRPATLLKNALKKVIAAPDLKVKLVDSVLSMAGGYLSKKIIVGNTHNPLKQIFGTLLQLGVTSVVSKNADTIKSVGGSLIKSIFSKKTELS